MLECEGDPEVGDQRSAIVQEDILGLDVAMDNVVAMRVVERAPNLTRDAHRVVDRQLRLPGQPFPERLALDEGHDVVQQSVGVARIDEAKDMRVLEVGRDSDFGEEARRTDCVGEFLRGGP